MSGLPPIDPFLARYPLDPFAAENDIVAEHTSCSVCESRDLFFLYFRVPEIPIFWEKSAEFRGIIAP